MGVLYSKCVNCNSVCTQDTHLLRVISLGKRNGQVWCIECLFNQRLEYINSKNLKNYIDYINTKYKDDRES